MMEASLVTSRTGEPTARGTHSRSAILAAAIPLFARGGYRGTSLASIAKAADLTQAGVLHHFPSKEHLLLALLEERNHHDGRRLKSVSGSDGLDVLPALEALVAHNVEEEDLVRLFVVLVAEATSSEHPAHDYFVDRYERVRSRLLRSLRQWQPDGEDQRPPVNLERVVTVIVAVMDGLQLQWLLDPQIDMVACFELFTSLVRTALSSDTGAGAPGGGAGKPD